MSGAGPPGFVTVLAADALAHPEYRGNGVMASLGNTRETGRAGLLFLDLSRERIGLHVNGRARVVSPEDLPGPGPWSSPDGHPGRSAALWVVVDVEEAYVHCRKHLPRLVPLPEQRAWGTDDQRLKGGDPFRVAASRAAEPPRRADPDPRRAPAQRWPNSQCHASGLLPPGCAHFGCTHPKSPARARIHSCAGVPNVSTPPQKSTASAQPWLLVPGTAASPGLRA